MLGMVDAARRTIPGLRGSGVAASDEVGRLLRGSTTILELLRMFPDGRAALCTFHGDVFIVSGIDEWKRERRARARERRTE